LKPILLKFRAFGPYIEEQTIDFNELSKVGLFLICGETGSGKTVILDAMTYALYGKSSGGGRGDITNMRCQFAPNDLSTEVEFIFEIHGRQYQFTRTMKYGRKNLNSTQNALILNDDGIFEPLFENPKIRDVEDKAKELLGLDYEQFRQVIILPQGQFERLLVAKSAEKEEILVSLFGADKWQKTSDVVNAKVNEERRRLDTEKSNIDRILRDRGCENFDELTALLTSKTEELGVRDKEIKEVIAQLNKTKKEYEIQNSIFEKFSSLEKMTSKLEQLKEQEDEISALKNKLEKATKANTIKPLFDNLETAEKQFKQRNLQIKEEKEQLSKFESALETAKSELDKSEVLISENDGDKIRLSKLSEMTENYSKIDEAQTALKSAEKGYNVNLKVVEDQVETVQRYSNEKLILSTQESTAY
jgi:exonuclease SbcC